MTPEAFAEKTGVSRETLSAFQTYHALLQRWQSAQNLVSPTTLSDIWHRHFWDSAQLMSLIAGGQNGGALLDIGSGAGFPGMVLAMLGHQNVHLVDSNSRKISFLRTVGRETNTPVTVHDARAESLRITGGAAIIIARACASITQLLRWSVPNTHEHTRFLFLKGARWRDELTAAQTEWRMTVRHHQSQCDQRGVVLELTGVEPLRGCA